MSTGLPPSRTVADGGRAAKPNLVLIGFMGVGKSTVGRLCATRLGYHFCDTDRLIEQHSGQSVPDLFARLGETAFREQERHIIADIAGQSHLVIATGGGAILDPRNMAALRATGLVVLLNATPEAIARRVGNARKRPLLADAPDKTARIREMLAGRLPHYRQAAHVQIETSGRASRDVADDVLLLYGTVQAETEE